MMRKELIEELIKQAQEDGDAIHYYNPAFAKRLVELTVRECANINYNSPFRDGELHARDMLYHFGVE